MVLSLRSASQAGAVAFPARSYAAVSLPVDPLRGYPFIHPRFRGLPPPVIVIGVHRSGTSVVAQLLAALGVYLGAPEGIRPLDPGGGYALGWNGEAAGFYRLNERLLQRAGARWDRVGPFLRRRDAEEFAGTAVRLLQLGTIWPLARDFLGPLPGKFAGPWGWKDPRNSLTLPYWLRLFPSARIIHVRRDAEAVARSLHRRAHDWRAHPPSPASRGQRLRAALEDPWAAAGAFTRRITRATRVGAPDPCLEADYCRRLTQQYLQQCFRVRGGGACYLELSYEALLQDPLAGVGELARFSGLDVLPERLRRATALVRPPGERPLPAA